MVVGMREGRGRDAGVRAFSRTFGVVLVAGQGLVGLFHHGRHVEHHGLLMVVDGWLVVGTPCKRKKMKPRLTHKLETAAVDVHKD